MGAKKKGTPWNPDGGSRGRRMRRALDLHDGYVRGLIASGDSELAKRIPADVVELKREALLLKRLGRQLNATFKELNHES